MPPERVGRFWSIAGLVCGIAACFSILILSAGAVLFGLLGILFGFLGYRKGDRGLGVAAMLVSAVALVIGVLLLILLLLVVFSVASL